MSDYIRYTERNKFGNADIVGVDSGELFKNLSNVQGVKLCDALNSFANLEDKIENGLIICPPCNVGDTLYWVYNANQIEPTEFVVKYLSVKQNDGRWMWYASDDFGHGGFVDFMRNYTWYLGNDKWIAEKYLKELQGEK